MAFCNHPIMWGMKEKKEKTMSLRKQARILGISHTYLSMLVNGKRKWPEELRRRYEELVTTNDSMRTEKESNLRIVVGGTGFEPVTSAMSTQRSKPLS